MRVKRIAGEKHMFQIVGWIARGKASWNPRRHIPRWRPFFHREPQR